MVQRITFANFKGGAGKTTNSVMVAYTLSKIGKKVLMVDLDPQANATTMLMRTGQLLKGEVVKFPSTLMTAIDKGDLSPIITNVKENLDLLPSFADFTSFNLYLEKKFPGSQKERTFFLSNLMKGIESQYDFVIIDTPPMLSVYTDNAVAMSDQIVITLQTEDASLAGARSFIKYLQEMLDTYELQFDIVGILGVLMKNNSNEDIEVLERATVEFGAENMFTTVVPRRERLKSYYAKGIRDNDFKTGKRINDPHDKETHAIYTEIVGELLERLGESVEQLAK